MTLRRLAPLAMLSLAACAGVTWFRPGPHPDALAGIWIDSSKATPTDTVAWKLDANGYDMTFEVKVAPDASGRPVASTTEHRYGYWFLQGTLAEKVGRALCFRSRPRDGATCYAFQLDTIRGAGGAPRRRLFIPAYAGMQHTRDRVLYERPGR